MSEQSCQLCKCLNTRSGRRGLTGERCCDRTVMSGVISVTKVDCSYRVRRCVVWSRGPRVTTHGHKSHLPCFVWDTHQTQESTFQTVLGVGALQRPRAVSRKEGKLKRRQKPSRREGLQKQNSRSAEWHMPSLFFFPLAQEVRLLKEQESQVGCE